MLGGARAGNGAKRGATLLQAEKMSQRRHLAGNGARKFRRNDPFLDDDFLSNNNPLDDFIPPKFNIVSKASSARATPKQSSTMHLSHLDVKGASVAKKNGTSKEKATPVADEKAKPK